MIERDKEVLKQLSKDQLIYLIEQFDKSNMLISCVLVDESKWHISSKEAINKIRDYVYDMPSLYDATKLKAFIDMEMGKISIEKYKKIVFGYDN